jgi:uncharacterized protein YceH (UPF0502 family)
VGYGVQRRSAGWSNRRMSNVSDDIEHRLDAAAQAMREREVTGQRQAELRARQRDLETEVAALREKAEDENKDVERLEGMSLGRVLASLAGSRDERLARERAEAEAARYKMAAAESRLAAVSTSPGRAMLGAGLCWRWLMSEAG